MDSPSRQSSVIDSPSLRKHRDMMSPRGDRHSHTRYSLPSTTPLKSPGVAFRQLQEHQQKQEASIFYDIQAGVPPLAFKVPTFLSRRATATSSAADTTAHGDLASSIHRRQASEMADSLARLLEDNVQSKSEASRQAQSSLLNANRSLEALRQSQRRSLDSGAFHRGLLRTTETEYDVSPNRTARLMASPSASSVAATPSSRAQRRQEASRVEDVATLEWLQNTSQATGMLGQENIDEEEHSQDVTELLDQRYTRQTSVPNVEREMEPQEDHLERQFSHQQQAPQSVVQNELSKNHRQEGLSPSHQRRSFSAREAYIQKENIPNNNQDATLHAHYSSLDSRTPDAKQHTVMEAETSLLEVAETTTTITNQLRGVYTNLQDFFSPETEAKLHGAISAIGSQKSSRVVRGLSASTKKPRPLDFRSASVRKDSGKPFSAPPPKRPLTEPTPFNFSERLDQLQRRHTTRSSQTPIQKMSMSVKRPSRSQVSVASQQQHDQHHVELESDLMSAPLRESTPIAQNQDLNEYQHISKSTFIPLAQRKKQLEKSNIAPRQEAGKRPLTEPKSPVLQTRTRVKATAPHESHTGQFIAQHGGYKAHKIDRRVFESSGDLGVPKVAKPALTVPKSPSLTKRRHAPLRPAVMPSKQPPPQQQHYRKFPPSIAQRGLVSSAESARRLSQERAPRSEQARARPHVTKPSLTVPEPFRLQTESRGARYQEQFQHKLDRWKQIEKEHQFKALPLPVYPDQFVPKKSTKPLTHSESVHLRTDQRAEEWEVFEQERERKEKLLQDMLAEKAREDEMREQQELRELRQRLVPHPTPIRDYPRIEIHKSRRPLTVPRSPNIGDKRQRQETMERELSGTPYDDHYRQHQHQLHHAVADSASSSARIHQPRTQDRQRTYEDPAYERERQRERERAQGHEFERRRQSANTRGGSGEQDRQRQDRVRTEIEQQREKDALDREALQQQQHQQQGYSQVTYERAEMDYMRESDQNKRQRLIVEEEEEVHLQQMQRIQPVYGRQMGRKSWLEANDL